MKYHLSLFYCALLLLVAETRVLADPPQSKSGTVKPSTASSKPKTERLAEAVAQVDGMTAIVVDRLWINTDRYWHQGDYYRIVDLLRITGEADPSFVDAYANGAWLLWSMGDTQAANDFLEHGLANAPARVKWEMQYELGYMLFAYKKDYRAALPHLKKAITYPGAPVIAYSNLAHCYERVGDLANSAETWSIVVTRFPEFVAGPPNLKRVTDKLKGGANRRGA